MSNLIRQSGDCCSSARENSGQPFPTTGRAKENTDLSLAQLKKRIREGASAGLKSRVYAYVLSSVRIEQKPSSNAEDYYFIQDGCAPNFQGGYITLCTCKHQMRSRLPKEAWPGRWIAGFTTRRRLRQHYLFYLMRVEEAFESPLALWNHSKIPEQRRQAKCASNDRYGDLFRPLKSAADAFRPCSYATPIDEHAHHKPKEPDQWHRDICYQSRSGHPPALLVGDPSLSFLWTVPIISSVGDLPRNYCTCDCLEAFLRDLKVASVS